MGEQDKQRLSKEVDDFVVLFVYFLLFVLFFSHFHFIAYLTELYSKVMQTSFLRSLEPSVKKSPLLYLQLHSRMDGGSVFYS